MAASTPFLMNAILALAALREIRISGHTDLSEAVAYHDKAVRMILLVLSRPDGIRDDCVVMTTVLLHLYEDHFCK